MDAWRDCERYYVGQALGIAHHDAITWHEITRGSSPTCRRPQSAVRRPLSMIVCKFGGTSVADAATIGRLVRIVETRLDDRPLIVVSALAGVTDALLALARAAYERDAGKVKEGLDGADWSSRREIIRALVKRVEINPEQINIVFRVPEQSVPQSPEKRFSQDCAGLREVERGGSVGDDFRWWLRDKLQLGYAHQCSFQFSPVTV